MEEGDYMWCVILCHQQTKLMLKEQRKTEVNGDGWTVMERRNHATQQTTKEEEEEYS